MAYIITPPVHSDERGTLAVLEPPLLPFVVHRIFYMYNLSGERGQHRNHHSRQALICMHGSCTVSVSLDRHKYTQYNLDSPDVILLIEPEDWRVLSDFSVDCVIVVAASNVYDASDYIR